MNDTLTFTTASFRAEKSSVLPSGVYSREFSSMLFASAICVAIYMLSSFLTEQHAVIRIAYLVLVFVISFLGARYFVFHEHRLEAVFNRKNGMLQIVLPGLLIRKQDIYPLDSIRSLKIGNIIFEPENIDGIKFVEKISAQHGSYVPGLGETEEFVTLSIEFKDGTERIIFAGKVDDEPEIPLREIRGFLGTNI